MSQVKIIGMFYSLHHSGMLRGATFSLFSGPESESVIRKYLQ